MTYKVSLVTTNGIKKTIAIKADAEDVTDGTLVNFAKAYPKLLANNDTIKSADKIATSALNVEG